MKKTIAYTLLVASIFAGCKKEANTDTTTPIPDSGIYVSAQFSESQLSKTGNLVYSSRPNFKQMQYTSINTKDAEKAASTLNLRMDIAVPPNASSSSLQPLIVFIHGGGFVTGDKSDLTADALSYAKAGYVVASVNYRLTENQFVDSIRTLSRIHALEDVGNAIRFLKSNWSKYFIDTTRVLTLGSSAGGGLSLINAVERDAITSTFDIANVSTRTNGAIATGATLKLDDVQGITPTYDAKDSPVLMFHASPTDSGTGATWQDALNTQSKINASGNTCDVYPQPDMTHTVSLALDGTYREPLKKFIWEKLRLSEK